MAVNSKDRKTATEASAARRLRVGANVLVACLLCVAVVVVAQAFAYSIPRRWDMTSSGVNSLSEGTENLLRGLDQDVRLTSLYFETDREDQDQPRYRKAVKDLLDLYGATNRTRITAEWVNPLKDHDRLRALRTRLSEMSTFASQIEPHRKVVETYRKDLDGQMRQLVESELAEIGKLGASIGASPGQSPLAPVENSLMRWSNVLGRIRERIDALTLGEAPQYSAAVNEISSLCRDFSKALKDIGAYGRDQLARQAPLSEPQAEFLGSAGSRYAELVGELEGQVTILQELDPPKVENITAQLVPTGNVILVETDDDAIVVNFNDVWPAMRRGAVGRAEFKNRAFKGEEKLTSAILRATHKQQTAVVFVRYGGPPPFMGGFMPGQPPGPYAAMKQQLEDANFMVEDWDVKSSTRTPTIEPTPTRTIYVVLKPAPPQRGPMGQPGREPPMSEVQKQAVLDAIGENGRAVFMAGWYPGPFGAIPATYEYNEYLEQNWGVKIDTGIMLMEVMSIGPGKYVVGRRDFSNMHGFEVSDHDIVSGALARELALPWCAPLDLSGSVPEGVDRQRLVVMPGRDGIWGVKNLQAYQQQLNQREYLDLADGDREGPFDLAVAATKGDAKLVVVSARDFATDQVAFARTLAVTSQGFQVRSLNPGNVTLFVNALHWLNDNREFMNIGQPIDAAVLQIGGESTVRAVQALTIFAWPALALMCGGVAWWVRRR